MPSVKKNESKDNYMGRCIPVLVQEGKKQNQAIAICSSMYDQSKRRKQSKADITEPDFDKENNFGGILFIPK